MEAQKRRQEINKARLIKLANQKSESYLLEAIFNPNAGVKPAEKQTIINLVASVMEIEPKDVQNHDSEEVQQAMKPHSQLERIQFRKKTAFQNQKKQFINLKNVKEQVALEVVDDDDKNKSETVAFVCTHYSVTESAKEININIVKRINEEFRFGVRTVENTALEKKDYVKLDREFIMHKGRDEYSCRIVIINDDGYEPDKDFFVELYDINDENRAKLPGSDTRTRVTIIDDDQPGYIGFDENSVQIKRAGDKATISLVRKKGSDGAVRVSVSTKELSDNLNHGIAGFDFKHIENKVVEFKAGETEQQLEIPIVGFEKTDTKRRVMERNIRNMDIKKRQ